MPRLIGILLLALLPSILSAQAQEDLIEDIRVSGNRRVSEDSILYRITTQKGEVLDPAKVTGDIKALWETGLFENLWVSVSKGTSGQVLVYSVRELPLVTETDFRGNQRLTKSTITDKMAEERLEITPDSPLDYRKINAIRKLIKDLLNERGLRYGTVDYKLETLDSTRARVVFNISEGSKVRIYKIDFDGNNLYSDRRLKKTMKKTKEHWMFSWLTQHDVFKQDEYDKDQELVKKKYWMRGYKDVFLGDPQMEISDHTSERQKRKNEKRLRMHKNPKEDKRMLLTLPLFEGEPYYMGQVIFSGNTILPATYYGETFPIKPGQVYDLGLVKKWIDDLEEIHNNAGYVHYNVQQEVKVLEGNVVDVTFEVKENDQVYVHRLAFKGNTTTRDKVIRREVLLREGDVFRVNFFRNSLLRINQLGFFDVSHGEPDIKFLPDENKVNITINGQESGVNELNFGVGFNEYRGTNGFLSFSTLNFLGRGQKLKFQGQIGSITNTYDITFTEPWLFDKPRGLTARIFNTRSNFSTSGFDLETTGFQLGLSFRPTVFSTYSISYTFSENRIPTVSSPDLRPVDNLLTSLISQGIQYNTTDHPFFPKKGRRYGISLDLAGWQAGGDNYFYKAIANGTEYLPVAGTTFVGLNARIGFLNTLEGQRPTRDQLFYIGGEESVRGYSNQGLGPYVRDSSGNVIAIRGDKLFQTNFEYIIPVSDQFRFVTFFDVGMIYGIDESWFSTKFARSTGLEMRFSLPVFQAPMRLIYAYRLDELNRDKKGGDIKFSIGTTF